ncbi:MAG: hypothetical protein M1820_001803 [Bogoriella megaspora]|nr:MAG: hypothetical protein M1820_001803 [Bogoriella megaspora]
MADEMIVRHAKNKSSTQAFPSFIALRDNDRTALIESSSCRKKDKSLSFTTTEQTPPTTPFTSTFTFDDLPTRDIVPQRSPTARRPLSFAFSETSSSSEDISSDERTHQRSDSEAARYLQQFQSTTARTTRPRYSRGNGSSTTTTTLPSLSHTPTSTIASTSIPYTPSTRPLPPRHNPHSTSLGSRGIDLVMPFTLTPALPPTAPASLSSLPSPHTHTHTTISPSSASTLKSAAVTQAAPIAADGVLSYTKIELPERRRTEGEAGEESRGGQEKGQGQGSLKQLFRFGEMQRQPKERRGWEEVGLVRGWSTTNLEGLRRQGFDE